MKSFPAKSSLLNTIAAAGADVTVSNGIVRIPGLIPVAQRDIVSYVAATDKMTPVAEVRQVVQVGVATVPTITASTKYQLMIGNTGSRVEGNQAYLRSYGYTSPAVLTGSAPTDRHNAYVSIAGKINADTGATLTAYPIITVDYDAQTVNFTAGATLTGGTSGATALIISDADGGATGTLTLGLISGTFANNELITDSSGGSADANIPTGATLGLGIHLRDDAGYYPAKGGRKGPNVVLATKGFTQAMVVITTAGVVGFGQGTRMIDDVPVMSTISSNIEKGTLAFNVQNSPIAAKSYRRYVLKSRPQASDSALSPTNSTTLVVQELWINETDNAGALAAFDAAIAANWVNV